MSLILRFPEAAPQWRERPDRPVTALNRFPFTIPYQITREDIVVLALGMRGERSNHSLQTTALVHEAYIRLVDYKRMQWQNRAHFEMRFFGGLSVEETATVLKVSPVTVRRDWSSAKIWLFRELTS